MVYPQTPEQIYKVDTCIYIYIYLYRSILFWGAMIYAMVVLESRIGRSALLGSFERSGYLGAKGKTISSTQLLDLNPEPKN